ncbi:MAG TPA: hypothetical protein PLP29_04230 [Candidatus Ozemobacteraceae bacterium]|nr:hypothetical protein [Candidatus Ozemobacteraceae bacterium]
MPIIRTLAANPGLRRWIFPLLFCIIGLTLLSFGCGGGGGGGQVVLPDYSTTGTISGTITASQTIVANQLPAAGIRSDVSVSGVEVWLEDHPEINTVTGTTGSFLLEGVPFGNHRIVARMKRLAGSNEYKVRSGLVSLNEVTSQSQANALELLFASARVSGILRNHNGAPIPNAAMYLWGEKFTTNYKGEFTTPPLPDNETSGELKLSGNPGFQDFSFTTPFIPGQQPQIEVAIPAPTQLERAPLVSLVSSHITISPNQQVVLTAKAVDPDDLNPDNLTVEWSATQGQLATGTDRFVARWTAPADEVIATVTIKVTDQTGLFGIARLPLKVGLGTEPGNERPVVSSVQTTGTGGNITITYTVTDADTDPIDMTVAWSSDGTTYTPTTHLIGSTTGIIPGTGRSLTWQSTGDLAGQKRTVRLRLTPRDAGGTGTAGTSAEFEVDNTGGAANTPPIASNLVTNGTSGDITLRFDLADAETDPCSIGVFYSTNGGTSYTQTTSLTGSTTGILPGTGKTVTWNSAADISGNQSNVRLRVVPNDGTIAGTAAISSVIAVSNNNLPSVTNVAVSGSSGNISITYTLADPNGDACSIQAFYSTDNGANYQLCSALTGSQTGITPGTGKTLTWNSAVDVPGNATAVKIKIAPNDGSAAGSPGESAAFAVSNNAAPVISNVAVNGTSGNITITYDLADANSNPCSIGVFYSTDGGSTFSQTTSLTGSTSALLPGTGKTLVWNSAANVTGNQTNVKLRLVPNDGTIEGTAGLSQVFAVNNNNLPSVSNVAVSGTSGNITITYDLADPNGDACSIQAYFSVDNGANYQLCTALTGTQTGITPGTGKELTWNSATDVPGNATAVKIKIVPSDASATGSPGESAAFAVSNNTPPSIVNVAVSGAAGNITITYDLSDINNNACSISVFYSTDGGSTFQATANLTGSTTAIVPGTGKSITWDSASNISGNEQSVRVRLVPNDGTIDGTAGLSQVFAVNNNGLPSVTNVAVSGTSGSISITYDLADPNGDACSIQAFYSTDNGANYQLCTNLTGTQTGIQPGIGKTLTWSSTTDVPGNSTTVKIKIAPNDGSATGSPGESQAFAVSNNVAPVVTNVAANGTVGNIGITFDLADSNGDSCSIAVAYSTDNGTTFLPTANVTGTTTGIKPGTGKSITWNSAADINGNRSNVKIRITPSDGVASGTAGVSAGFSVTNNNLPTISAVTTSGTSGSITVTYTLSDPNNDPCSVAVFYSIDSGVNYAAATNVAGTLTGVTPGTGKTLTWSSTSDVNTNKSTVKVKLVPSDSQGNGTPGESGLFTVNNNQLPVVSGVSTSGTSGPITISYTLADSNNEPCGIRVYYSTDNGTSYLQTGNIVGSTTGILPGSGRTVTWNSTSDVNRNAANVKVRIEPIDAVGAGTAAESPAFGIQNNQLPAASIVSTTGTSGNITITYNLTDANGDACSIAVAYSTDGGTTFTPATSLTGTQTGIQPQSNLTIVWNSSLDVAGNQSVKLRITPSDASGAGTAGISQTISIQNNAAPVVTNITPTGTVGDIAITYQLTDSNNDPCSIAVFYSTNGGTTYVQTGNVIGSTTGILPGSRTITWNSAADIPGTQSTVRIKIQPNDGKVDGTAAQSPVFSVDNNNLPIVTAVTTTGSSGDITVGYTLSDANGDNCSISVYYSTDNGTTYAQTTNLTGTLTNIPPGAGKSLTWHSSLDVSGNATGVKIKVTPRDATGVGNPGESAAFAVNNNTAPVISAVVASGTNGNITVTYTLVDGESDPCSIGAAFSINGGSTYTSTTRLTGTTTGITPGTARTIVWNSQLDVPTDQANVRFRLTPNDGISSGTPSESQVFALSNSNQPPTITTVTTSGNTGDITLTYTLTDPNNDPCSIEVYYSTSGGSFYALTSNVTGQTTNILPGTARTIIWNSPPDMNGSLGNIKVKVVPTDRGGAGTGAESAPFAIDNLNRPTVSNLTTSGSRGNITLSYDLADPNANPCSIAVYYSLDNGVNYKRTTQLTGQTTAISPGNGQTIVWNSSADVSGSYSQMRIKVSAHDGTGYGTLAQSAAFPLNNDGIPYVSRILTTGNSGNIQVSYDLADPNGDACSIAFFYSIDGGVNYTQTTSLSNGLQTNIAPGAGRTITWNSASDILGTNAQTRIKIIPSDAGGAGIPEQSPIFTVRNNRLPVISAITTTGNTGDIGVSFTLTDADSDPCSISVEYSTDAGSNWFPTTNLTGTLTGVTPGTGKNFTWQSANDFKTNKTVRLRLTANDGAGSSIPFSSPEFSVVNNTLPTVSNVVATGASGTITLTYDLADPENNPCAMTVAFSINGGLSYTTTTQVGGQVSNVLPGTGRTLTWDSGNDVTTNQSSVRVRITPNDSTGNGTAGITSTFALQNNSNFKPVVSALTRTGAAGTIALVYTLTDGNNDPCNVTVYYSPDGGATFYQTTNVTGALSNVLPGTGRTIQWNSLADVNTTKSNVIVKLVPQDALEEGTATQTAAFTVTNNALPAVSSVTVSGTSGPIPISYALADANGDACTVSVQYSIDGGLSFTPTTNVSGTLSGVTPGNRSLTWNSAADIPGNVTAVRVKLVASDSFNVGTPGETGSFGVSNNALPVVSGITVGGSSGSITLGYTLTDANANPCSIEVFYSTDGGLNYTPTTDVVGSLTNVVPGSGRTITWNSATGINRNQSNVRVKLVPSDIYGTGTAGQSTSFTVSNNLAPVVSAVTRTGGSGNITVSYTLADGNDNACSVLFYYSIDSGTNYTLSNNVTGVTTNLTPGAGKILTWNSAADIGTDLATVRVRVVANDGTVSGAPGDSAIFSVSNNQAPVVSNLRTTGNAGDITLTYDLSDGNGNPASISVRYSTDNGVTYLPATSLLGQTTSIAPGTNKSVIWNSASNINNNISNVRVRIQANDGVASGPVADSAAFAVNNNGLPVVSDVTTTGTGGDVVIGFKVADPNANFCSIQVYYSTDGGSSYTQTASLTGALSGLTPGVDVKNVTWHSGANVPGASSQVKVKVVPNDGTGNGTAGESALFAVTNNTAPTVSGVGTAVAGSNVTITYTLADAQSNPCSIAVYYSIDGGTSFLRTSNLGGGSGITGLTPGARSIVWNSLADYNGNTGNIRVKVEPNDGLGSGTAGLSNSFALTNNTLPTVANVAIGGTAGAINIGYDLIDAEQNACSIEVHYSLNGGISYTKTTSLTGVSTNIAAGTGKSIIWNSGDDFSGNESNVFIRIVANDGYGNGTAGVQGPFPVNNNVAPVVTGVTTSGSSGNIGLTFTLADANTHPCDLSVDYSIDGGTTWASATGITGTTAGVTPGAGKTLTWNSRLNIPANVANVKARITPRDPYQVGTAGISSAFAISNNRLPVVRSITTTGTSGNVSVQYSLEDLDDNPCNIGVFYSVNGGAFTATSNVTGNVTAVPPGSGINLVWNSAADGVSFSNDVRLRLVPNDGTGAGASAESGVFLVNNVNEPPTVSNVSVTLAAKTATFTYDLADGNNQQCSIAVAFSTDNGATWQPATNLTGVLTNILPGTTRKITWRNYPDITSQSGTVKVRITPNDGIVNGNAGTSPSFAVDNTAPVVSNVKATKRGDNNYDVTYDLSYPSSETGCAIGLYYTTDGGATWLHSASSTGVLPGSNKSLIWSATTDLPGPTYYSVSLELRPLDGTIAGLASRSAPIPVNNADKPVVVITKRDSQDPRGVTNYNNNITIAFTITDPSSTGSFTAFIDYTANNGLSWQPITVAENMVGVSAIGTATWESYRDFAGNSPGSNARIRIRCTDGEQMSDTVYCPASFTLANSHKPDLNQRFIDVDATGYYGTAALSESGQVWVWGSNPSNYYLGDNFSYTQPTQVLHANWQNVTDVACTYAGVLALGSDKTIRCVGYSQYGEFGNGGSGSNYSTPGASPSGLNGVITAISCSYHHTLALHQDGTVRAFGYNAYGQLGDGTTTNRNTPVQVAGLSNVKAIAAGGYTTPGFSLALKNDGTVWSWGYNGQGQLGHGDTTTKYAPVQIQSLSNVKAIAAGANHSLFLLENGKVYYCGHDGAAARGSTPIEVVIGTTPLVDIQKIFAGQMANSQGNSFAIDSQGNVFGWGYNTTYDVLGLNNTTTQATPVRIPGISRIAAVAVGKMSAGWATYVGSSPTGNSGIWTTGYGTSYYMLGNGASGNYIYLCHP